MSQWGDASRYPTSSGGINTLRSYRSIESTMSADLVSLMVDDSLATLRLQRPDHGNKITYEMLQQFIDRLQDAHDADVDLLLLEGAGEDFCVGRDQEEDLSSVPWENVITGILDANEFLTAFEGISITAVTGRAIGFGCGIAVQSDITLAAETAVLGFDEIKHGIAPKIVLSYLETYVGRKTALDLILTGRPINAIDAVEMGLVSRTAPDDLFDDSVVSCVDRLAGYDPAALTEIKFFLRDIQSVPPADRRAEVVDRMT